MNLLFKNKYEGELKKFAFRIIKNHKEIKVFFDGSNLIAKNRQSLEQIKSLGLLEDTILASGLYEK